VIVIGDGDVVWIDPVVAKEAKLVMSVGELAMRLNGLANLGATETVTL
jgi:hypothetical protein